ncbi:fibronectin type III domain-containing protein [Amycolatopsis sp. NPDC058986]|uniref:fibronectin type III domain-containing protein n=1 Tax=unclassified Amycolatopsis TaxID=2618356 RepID=UPI0036718AF9
MPEKPRRLLVLLAAYLAAAGCAAPAPAPRRESAAGLTATLTTPLDIVLRWPDDPAAAGTMLEFATDPNGPYTTLQYLPPHLTTYTHPDLLPQTSFYYRIRPFFGPASAPLADGTQPAAPPPAGAPVPVRTPGDAAAPVGLHSAREADGTLKFTWADRTTDEEGFLLEQRKPGTAMFAPVEVTGANTTSCELSTLPGEEGAAYRVRAFFTGPPSPLAHQTTGAQR